MTQPDYPWRLWYRPTSAHPWTCAGDFRTRRELTASQLANEQKGYACKPEYLGSTLSIHAVRNGGGDR